MRNVLLTGVAGIALLVAGSVAVLVVLTGDGRARPGAAGAAPEAPEAFAPPPREGRGPATPPPGEITYGSAAPPEEPPPAVVTPAAPPPAAGSWEAVPITARAKGLGRMGGALQAALNELHDELRACFTAEGQARFGGEAVSTAKDATSLDESGAIILVLQLEAQAGSVRVVDAPVETRGPAGDDLLACAQRTLRGKVLEVPGARPGGKYRLLYPLNP